MKFKGLKSNQPHFNPSDDYIVPDHSLAIIIEVNEDKQDG